MRSDAFSKCHPAVNFIFFLGAIGFGVVIQHPVYVAVGCLGAGVYYLLLSGRKGLGLLLGLLPFVVLIAAVNPLFNTQGEQVLFTVFSRPYTFEALMYGCALGGIFLVMMLWFGCYSIVMSADKFTSLFGNLIPSISLLLVMVLRMVPTLLRKAAQIAGARKSIGKGAGEAASVKEKLTDGMTVLGTLTAWALEGSIVTADSMRVRGYGCAKRSSFMIYRMGMADWLLLAGMAVLILLVAAAAWLGQTAAVFTPELSVAPVSWGIVPYAAYLLLPAALHLKEEIQWHISRSKI